MKQLISDNVFDKNNPMGKDKKYSRAIRVPQYEPSEKMPSLSEMYDLRKYSRLVARIKRSNVSKEEKKFLIFAATRHIVFTFSKIADYYAHAGKEMQELMEESALVILDMDDAIANGYVALTDKMRQLIKEEKERDRKAKEAAKVFKRQREILHKAELEKPEKEKIAKQIDSADSVIKEGLVLDEDAMKMAEEDEEFLDVGDLLDED